MRDLRDWQELSRGTGSWAGGETEKVLEEGFELGT